MIRNSAVGMLSEIGSGVHGYLRFRNCRVPRENILGKPGQGFEVAQSRLGGGRIHHAMRTVGLLGKALDMMCERALSRHTKGEPLSQKQLTQEKISDSYNANHAIPVARTLCGLAYRQAQGVHPRGPT